MIFGAGIIIVCPLAQMSGLEAAGLVLGAIPIIIWSLEKYKTTREIWRRSRNKALLVDRMINTLQEQQFLIKADLQILLRTAGVEDVETSGIDPSYYREHLVKPRVTKALMRYLGPAYQVYRNRLNTCERILAEIAQNIGGLTPQILDPVSWIILRCRYVTHGISFPPTKAALSNPQTILEKSSKLSRWFD